MANDPASAAAEPQPSSVTALKGLVDDQLQCLTPVFSQPCPHLLHGPTAQT